MTRLPTRTTRDPRPADRIGLRLEMSLETRDRLFAIAGRKGKSMASLLRRVVNEYIEAEERKAK